MAESNTLSPRECEILSLVAKRASNKEIARDIHISTNTVKVHLRNIFTKIDANSRTEAAMYAVNTGLVEVDSQRTADQADDAKISGRTLYLGLGILAVLLIIGAIAVFLIWQNNNNNRAMANQPIIDEGQRWQYKAPLSEARRGLALSTYGGYIFAIGGETEREVTGLVERYDPNIDTWTNLKSKPVPVSEASAAVIGGKIYVPGGRTSSNEVSNVLEIYSPSEDQWESGAELPTGLSAYGMVSFEGQLYLFGGWNGSKVVDSVYRYDPETDSWQELTSMPTARAYTGVSIIDEKIYIISGFDGEKSLANIEIYSPDLEGSENSPWEIDDPLPGARYASGVASLAGTMYVIGGMNEQEGQPVHLGKANNVPGWSEFTQVISDDFAHMGIVAVGTHLYIIGGELDGVITDQNLAYQAIYSINLPVVR